MRTIKRYPNRKLYDMTDSRYITLNEIADLVRDGVEIRVIDSKTSEDITKITLAQVLLAEERVIDRWPRSNGSLPFTFWWRVHS